jgi:antitoxin HigA-1
MAINRTTNAAWRIHPGEILHEEFMKPLSISSYKLAHDLRVSTPTVNEIVRKKKAISAEMAARLAKYFGTTEQFWLNLQGAYDISRIRSEKRSELKKIKPLKANTAVAQLA